MSTLKPCPFCGSDMQGCDVQFGIEDREGYPVNLVCPDCGACGPQAYARHPHLDDVATSEWNRRITHETENAKLHAFVEAVKRLPRWEIVRVGKEGRYVCGIPAGSGVGVTEQVIGGEWVEADELESLIKEAGL